MDNSPQSRSPSATNRGNPFSIDYILSSSASHDLDREPANRQQATDQTSSSLAEMQQTSPPGLQPPNPNLLYFMAYMLLQQQNQQRLRQQQLQTPPQQPYQPPPQPQQIHRQLQQHLRNQQQQPQQPQQQQQQQQQQLLRQNQTHPQHHHHQQQQALIAPAQQLITGFAPMNNPHSSKQPIDLAKNPSNNLDSLKPAHSYIGLIGMCILSTPEKRMVLNDIYQFILDHYPYYRNRGSGWRNSVRHNLSLNECFQKSGRAANGKGHYWTIHPANMADFMMGDFRRRRAQRKVRRWNNMDVPSDESDDESMDDATKPPLPEHFKRSLEMHRRLSKMRVDQLQNSVQPSWP